MTSANQKKRSIYIQTIYILEDGQDPRDINWKTDGLLGVEAYDGLNAWTGRLPLEKYRKDWPHDGDQIDLSGFDELIELLSPIPLDKIYPKFNTQELTRYNSYHSNNESTVYFKAPKLCHYRSDNSTTIATRLLQEARIHEKILANPHPNLGCYLGCVEEGGRLVRLAFHKYCKSVSELCLPEAIKDFSSQQRIDCMNQVEAAAAHLHIMGLAHNDISPSNIMFNNAGKAILIDFDCCAPLGSPLTKGGWVTGWKGPLADEEHQFTKSSAECDMLAIQEIRKYLTELGG